MDGHDSDGDMRMELKHLEGSTGVIMEGRDTALGGGARLEYWTPPAGKNNGNNNNGNALSRGIDLCDGSIINYGDDMLLPKEVDSLHGHDVRSCWRDLTGASRTSSVTKPFNGNGGATMHHGCRLGRATVDEEKLEYHGRVLKVGDDGEEADHGIAGSRQRWEEAATSEGEEIHHAQYNIQKEELRIDPCQVDRSIDHHRLQSGRDLEMLGIDIRRRSCQVINELDVDLERGKVCRDHVTYGECQKNQSADRGVTSVDGCGVFLSSGNDGKLAFTCAACGCHRNFHQRVVIFEGEEQELTKPKREKEEGGGNYYTATCGIDRVAHELLAAANRAITVAQESLCYTEGRAREISMEEKNIIVKISIENLDHIAKVINSTTECLTLLRKPSMFRKDSKSDCPHEGPSSSDASPVITVEKRAIQSLLTPPSPAARPFGEMGGQPVKDSITMFSDACAMHNRGSTPRKPLERPTQKMKRTRTRISMEQREKLNAFAEKAGWTVVGQRKETIDAACQYIGIEPKTLKYWIHNSKQKWKRQPGQSDDISKQ